MRDRLGRAKNLYRKDLKAHFGCVNAIEFSNDGGEWMTSGDSLVDRSSELCDLLAAYNNFRLRVLFVPRSPAFVPPLCCLYAGQKIKYNAIVAKYFVTSVWALTQINYDVKCPSWGVDFDR